ncbi:uncharacterized protein [Nicotiana sylvestris]|uniref:uncharacterized protein n=1 Tax=Nicotiana sylvestris TaxID=4096 RepID=UPI00388C7F53
MERISYARILIGMDVTVPLPETIKVQDPTERNFSQKMEYIWKPEYCGKCLMIGHNCNEIRQQKNVKTTRINVQKKVWQIKGAAGQMQEKEKEKETAINTKNQTVAGNNEGWKEVKGKSAAKPTHATPEGRMSITNGFNILNKQTEHEQQSDQGRIVERGQCSRSSVQCYFTAVYGLHTVEDKKVLWQELEGIQNGIDGAWIAMGDYNAVLGVDDRKSDNPVQEVEIRDFRDFMLNNDMNELKYIGRKFTWTNSHVWSKIDRAIINAEWMTIMKQLEVVVMEPFISDHTPLCLYYEEKSKDSPKPYRFYNYVVEHPELQKVVEKAWNTSNKWQGMERVWQKLKVVKQELKKMHTEEFKKVRDTVQTIRKQLQETQEKMQDSNHQTDLFNTEKKLRGNLEKWGMREESIMRQKSRTKWLKLGDSNSA